MPLSPSHAMQYVGGYDMGYPSQSDLNNLDKYQLNLHKEKTKVHQEKKLNRIYSNAVPI